MGSSSLTRKMPFIAHASGSPVCGLGVLQLPFQVSRSYCTLRQHPELLNRNCHLQFSACFTDEIREPHPCRGQMRIENEVGQVLTSVCSEQSLDGDGQRTLWARKTWQEPSLTCLGVCNVQTSGGCHPRAAFHVGPSDHGLGCGKGPAVPPALRRSFSCRIRHWLRAAAVPST